MTSSETTFNDKELIAWLRKWSGLVGVKAADRIEALEAKLTAAIKLAELIRRYAGMGMNPSTDLQHMASDLLAILKGESHE